MKIKLSLRLYFIAATIVLVSAITLGFSALSIQYLFHGLDVGVKPILHKVAEVEGVSDGHPAELLDFYVASRWEDLPEDIRDVFNNKPLTELRQFEKVALGTSLINPPEAVYIATLIANKSGEKRFIVSQHIVPADIERKSWHLPPLLWIAILSVGSIGIFLGGLLIIIRTIATPVESLKNWAKSLDENNIKKEIPDFQYSELNTLASIVNSSLNSTHEALLREQKFLSHASHELRTPISVLRANTELLVKFQKKEGTTPKQTDIVSRIDRAGRTMTSLTDTLLWLSRDNDNLPESESVSLNLLVEELVSDLSYLLENKPVELTVETKPFDIQVAETPCRIVIANLVRNAFQHTMDGKVEVKQSEGTLTIVNTSAGGSIDNSELGFGLGLQLTRQLVARYQWQYDDHIEDDSYQASIQFD